MTRSAYPAVLDPSLVGTYPALAKAGGGYLWDEVLEYRVWSYPLRGAPDLEEGHDYFHSFATYEDVAAFAASERGTGEPLALILQNEYLDEPEPGRFIHRSDRRVAEWPVEFLNRPRRTPNTIPWFLSPDAPANRLDVIRGVAPAPEAWR